jgi:hypothetical protein
MIAVDTKYVLTEALKAFQDRHYSLSLLFSRIPRPKIANAQIQDQHFCHDIVWQLCYCGSRKGGSLWKV